MFRLGVYVLRILRIRLLRKALRIRWSIKARWAFQQFLGKTATLRVMNRRCHGRRVNLRRLHLRLWEWVGKRMSCYRNTHLLCRVRQLADQRHTRVGALLRLLFQEVTNDVSKRTRHVRRQGRNRIIHVRERNINLRLASKGSLPGSSLVRNHTQGV